MNYINDNTPTNSFILAEIGLNHNKDVSLACRMIDDAIKSGADGVKFQTYITEHLMTVDNPAYKIFKDLELSADEFRQIAQFCKSKNVPFISTPFCHETVELLAELDVPAFKIASSDITYLDLIGRIAEYGKPVILSTGMSDFREIDNAVETILRKNNNQIIIFHCISKYPPAEEDLCLNAIAVLKNRYSHFRIGFSDHTLNPTAAVAAHALGATFFEKHFTSDRSLPGPDQQISTNPAEMKIYTDAIHSADKMCRTLSAADRADMTIAPFARRSLFAVNDIHSGSAIQPDDITALRPGNGIPANEMESI
ncbi:MAG: N-acetylneuraminate synthase family protein, partial [Spirochaetales bacterium]|nr:N-acetylneuraminate synthase family protein [Spirochaetales bacterium]